MTGRIAQKNGYYYAVISYKNSHNEYKQKWLNTGLKIRGNKKNADKFLEEQLKNFTDKTFEQQLNKNKETKIDNDIIFSEYMEQYVSSKQKGVSASCYETYLSLLKIIKDYFGKKLKLRDVTYHHIEEFYDYLRNERKVKNVTIKHYATLLSPALRMAYRDDLIRKNPYEFMPRITKEKPRTNYYNQDELKKLFEITDKTNIGLIVRVAAHYGFRRSELLGLRWQAIDFVNKTITIEHKVIYALKSLRKEDNLKTRASKRTLPLLSSIEPLLLQRKKEIEYNKQIYGLSYNPNFYDYIFVKDDGDLMLPDYVTQKFNKILKKNKLKHIRFHDLRHSCATLLLANGVAMKNIQDWLGHANYNTTADVYSHLDFSSKNKSADIIVDSLKATSKEENLNEIQNEIDELEKLIALKTKLLEEKKKQDEME